MTPQTARLRALFVRMVVIEVVCAAFAVAAFAGFVMGFGKPFLGLFATALVAGFAAQVWFIWAWLKTTAKV